VENWSVLTLLSRNDALTVDRSESFSVDFHCFEVDSLRIFTRQTTSSLHKLQEEIVIAFFELTSSLQGRAGSQTINFYCDFVEELVRISSESGQGTTAPILSRVVSTGRRALPLSGVEGHLFDICYRVEFSSENSQWHAKYATQLIQLTLAMYPAVNPETFSSLICLWIDFATKESLLQLSHGRNILDHLCLVSTAKNLDDLESLIQKVVKLGGCLTSEDAPGINLEAAEIYREARRALKQSAQKTNAISQPK
jgi:hypothetical protein